MGNLIRANCGCGNMKWFSTYEELKNAKCESCRGPYVPVPDTYAAVAKMPEYEREIVSVQLSDNIAKVTKTEDKFALYKALGLLALANASHQNAQEFFTKAKYENPRDAEIYYYLGISKLNGKRPFSQTRSIIDEIIKDINMAIGIEPKGKYYYLQALLVADYYEAKYLNYVSTRTGRRVGSRDLLYEAEMSGVSSEEKNEIFDNVKFISKPKGF